MAHSARTAAHYNPLICRTFDFLLRRRIQVVVRRTKKPLTRGCPDPNIAFVRCSKASAAMTPDHPDSGIRGLKSSSSVHRKRNAMYNATEQFAAINRTNVEQATKLAAVALQNAEKIFNANLEAAKFALAQGAESAAAAASVKDVQELFALPARYAEYGVQGALGYSRNLYEIASETQAQFTAVAEEAFAAYTRGFASW